MQNKTVSFVELEMTAAYWYVVETSNEKPPTVPTINC
jgi:hypothetical protein